MVEELPVNYNLEAEVNRNIVIRTNARAHECAVFEERGEIFTTTFMIASRVAV